MLLLDYLVSNGLGVITERYNCIEGDLVWMDMIGDPPSYEHVAIISGFGFDILDDLSMGTLGFYGSPVYYRCHEAKTQQLQDVLYSEWTWHCQNAEWGFRPQNFLYVHIYE